MTGIVTNLKFGNRNAGFMETEGYDLDVSYRLDTRFGKFNVNSATTYVSSATYRTSNDNSIVPIVTNGIGSASASVPTWCWATSGATSARAGPRVTIRA